MLGSPSQRSAVPNGSPGFFHHGGFPPHNPNQPSFSPMSGPFMQPSYIPTNPNLARVHSSTPSTPSTPIMGGNRSQRCGSCDGCTSKQCGKCTYCLDSPLFGGPGVKKQSCIERRCHRVMENKLQREAATLKVRRGCGTCPECQAPDCDVCLPCQDRKFFQSRYLPGASCLRKRCGDTIYIDSTKNKGTKRPSSNSSEEQDHKRSMHQQHVFVPNSQPAYYVHGPYPGQNGHPLPPQFPHQYPPVQSKGDIRNENQPVPSTISQPLPLQMHLGQNSPSFAPPGFAPFTGHLPPQPMFKPQPYPFFSLPQPLEPTKVETIDPQKLDLDDEYVAPSYKEKDYVLQQL
ncbi:unnamed protein product [Bursaphelenchus xylophilus]|uniref:(pine wood nematode) hypothetical protein n=1 Tax=Bursaphelenchus xylophilus TaxID=6326 RepID=A0A1I7SCC3_BURXY|nr:unnamed protein product [Bursaphelenchus xylophilus]CAG9094373.1 unnamed protein product [Bursaphelenchus xylophilus]